MDATTCRFFQSPNGCFRGESCTFKHEYAPGTEPASDDATKDPAAGGIGGDIVISASNPYANVNASASAVRACRFYTAATGCRNGPQCPFAHIAPPGMMSFGMDEAQQPSDYSMYYAGVAPGMMVSLPPVMPPMMLSDPPLPPHMQQLPSPPPPVYTNGVGSGTSPTAGNDSSTSSSSTTPRRALSIQANPSKTGNYEVISEILPVLTRDIEGPFFAIDVECVATGKGTKFVFHSLVPLARTLTSQTNHVFCVVCIVSGSDRDVARIAIVDEDENVVYDRFVKPDKHIVSYLTQLTGITESNLVGAPSLDEALVELKRILPVESVIVGQSIKKDLEWLLLEKDKDYKQMFDVADLFRIPMQSQNGTIRYRYFSLRHVAKYLLGHNIQEADHDPVIDAKYAMKIFKQFRYLHESPGHRDAVYQTLLKTPRTPSFAERYPMIDGVAMRAPRKPSNHPFAREHTLAPPPPHL
ncbi:Rna exonuclease 4, partial [Globisporangium splendens]